MRPCRGSPSGRSAARVGFAPSAGRCPCRGHAAGSPDFLLGGRVADFTGRKRAFIIGLTGFAAASALGGAATSEAMLLTARAVQGLFGALMAPAALSLLTVTFAEGKERARAFGVYGAIAGGGSAIGLIMGGVLTEYISWRWTLLVNVPIAVLAAITATRVLSESKVRGNTSRRVELTPLGEQLRDRLAPAWSEAEAALADARATARHMDGTLRLGWPPTASSPV